MKDSGETGLFHLSPACWSISTPPCAALVGLGAGEGLQQLAMLEKWSHENFLFASMQLCEQTKLTSGLLQLHPGL